MKNKELVKILYNIAIYLRMEDIPIPFKFQAYERVAFEIENLGEEIQNIYKKEGLDGIKKISGVGESIAKKIEEYLKTGKIKYYQSLKRKMPVNLEELISVEGIGPKMVKTLYGLLKIKNLEELEKAAKSGKINKLPNFGEKTEQNILQGIEFLKRDKGRFLLGEILPDVKKIIEELKIIKEIRQINYAGSIRRMKETIGDVDILITALNPKKVIDFFISLPGIEKVWARGVTKASVRMESGYDVDVRIISKEDYGSALQYFTGSKEHNIEIRKIAIKKGLKLSEYGIFKGKKEISSYTEKELYNLLDMDFIEPELRENSGEIEAALNRKLPKIVRYNELLGDLHIHSNWNGGHNSIEEIVKEAKKYDYEYVGISDHTKFLRIENGLDENKLLLQKEYIKNLNKKSKGFKVLQGAKQIFWKMVLLI